jgi:hypothetical protein
MADCSICYNKIIDHPAPPESGTEATGSFRSSCGHLFHPKCIWTWFSAQDESSCPLCRKKATELEDIRPHEEEEEELVGAVAAPAVVAPADLPVMGDSGWILISRANLEQVLFNQGGPVGTWAAAATAQLEFDQYDEVEICRDDFERILRETGARVFSDAEWDHLMAIYPHFGTWPLPAARVPEPAPASEPTSQEPASAPASEPTSQEPASAPAPEPELLFPDWEPEVGSSDPLSDDLREAIERESLANLAKKAANDTFRAICTWEQYCEIDDKAKECFRTIRESSDASEAGRTLLSKRANHIYIPRKEMEHILHKQGGQVTADVEQMFYSREHNHKWITQTEFNQILCKQGATLLSDAQWERLRAAFPLQTPVIGREPPMWCPLEEGDEDELTRISRIAVEE